MKPSNKCYDCGDICTRDYKYIDVLTQDEGELRLPIHYKCHERALNAGAPVYPERNQPKEGK